MKKRLQQLYDDCNWKGYAIYKRKKIYLYEVYRLAELHKVELIYNCYA